MGERVLIDFEMPYPLTPRVCNLTVLSPKILCTIGRRLDDFWTMLGRRSDHLWTTFERCSGDR